MTPIIIKMCRILLYYDVPELFVALDEEGTNYLCLLSEDMNGNLHYICTRISDIRLYDISMGKTDVRDVFVAPEIPAIYEFYVKTQDAHENFIINPVDILKTSLLPERDLYLTPPIKITSAQGRTEGNAAACRSEFLNL